MALQKIVVRLQMEDAKKRTKALKITVGLPGVTSATLEGDRIVVVGNIDSVKLVVVLRKKMRFAELVSVGAAEEESMLQVMYPYQTYQSNMEEPVLVHQMYDNWSCGLF